jgi:hypothetical protein
MKSQRILIALTVINLGLMMFLLERTRRVEAMASGFSDTGSEAPILRGRELQIVDDQGRVRASIKLHPADPNFKMPNGKTGYPETVMFRLIDAKGRPEVKIGGSEQGGGVGLIGETDTTSIKLITEGAESYVELNDKDGRKRVIRP